MSGFLQRLALRESGAAASISPRLPSWFEPMGAGEGVASESVTPAAVSAAMPARTPPASSVAEAVSTPAEVRVSPAGPAPVPAAATYDMAGVPRQPDARIENVVQAVRQSIPPSRLQPPARPASSETGMAPSSPTQADRAPMAPRQADSAPLQTSRSVAFTVPPGAALPRPAIPEQDWSPQSVRQERAQPQSAPPRAALEPSPARMAPAAVRAARSADALHAAQTAPPVPQTVQVTIGRVEVRAVQSAKAAPQPPRSVQAPTSLDEHLARCNREVRR